MPLSAFIRCNTVCQHFPGHATESFLRTLNSQVKYNYTISSLHFSPLSFLQPLPCSPSLPLIFIVTHVYVHVYECNLLSPLSVACVLSYDFRDSRSVLNNELGSSSLGKTSSPSQQLPVVLCLRVGLSDLSSVSFSICSGLL